MKLKNLIKEGMKGNKQIPNYFIKDIYVILQLFFFLSNIKYIDNNKDERSFP